jgi:hypothetical protein
VPTVIDIGIVAVNIFYISNKTNSTSRDIYSRLFYFGLEQFKFNGRKPTIVVMIEPLHEMQRSVLRVFQLVLQNGDRLFETDELFSSAHGTKYIQWSRNRTMTTSRSPHLTNEWQIVFFPTKANGATSQKQTPDVIFAAIVPRIQRRMDAAHLSLDVSRLLSQVRTTSCR